jgi:ent-kaurene oxidase
MKAAAGIADAQQYRDSMYLVQTVDMDRLIVGNRYLEELRQLPPHILSSIDAICDRHLAFWNGMDHVKTSQLHTTVTKGPLCQNLGISCRSTLGVSPLRR